MVLCHPRHISSAFTALETLQISSMRISKSTTCTQPQGAMPWHSTGSKVCYDHLPPKQRFISAARGDIVLKTLCRVWQKEVPGSKKVIHTAQETLLFNTPLCSDLLLLTENTVHSFQTLKQF